MDSTKWQDRSYNKRCFWSLVVNSSISHSCIGQYFCIILRVSSLWKGFKVISLFNLNLSKGNFKAITRTFHFTLSLKKRTRVSEVVTFCLLCSLTEDTSIKSPHPSVRASPIEPGFRQFQFYVVMASTDLDSVREPGFHQEASNVRLLRAWHNFLHRIFLLLNKLIRRELLEISLKPTEHRRLNVRKFDRKANSREGQGSETGVRRLSDPGEPIRRKSKANLKQGVKGTPDDDSFLLVRRLS